MAKATTTRSKKPATSAKANSAKKPTASAKANAPRASSAVTTANGAKPQPADKTQRTSANGAKQQPAGKTKRTAADAPWRAPDGWTGLASLVVTPDGRAFAGRAGKAGLCAWTADGALAWTLDLPFEGTALLVDVQATPTTLFSHVKTGDLGFFVNADTGTLDRTIRFVPFTRAAAVALDVTRLFLRVNTQTIVFELPVLKYLATLEDYANEQPIAVSPDGRTVTVCGSDIHVLDAEKAARERSFTPPSSPYVLAFTPTGELVTGDGHARACLFSLDGTKLVEVDTLADQKRKHAITAVAGSVRGHIAAARADGVVSLIDRDGRIVATFVHAPLPGSGGIGGVAFSADGSTLWVSAAGRKQPVGVTRHAVP